MTSPDVSTWDEERLLKDESHCLRIILQYHGSYYAELCCKRLTVVQQELAQRAALAPAAAQSAETGA